MLLRVMVMPAALPLLPVARAAGGGRRRGFGHLRARRLLSSGLSLRLLRLAAPSSWKFPRKLPGRAHHVPPTGPAVAFPLQAQRAATSQLLVAPSCSKGPLKGEGGTTPTYVANVPSQRGRANTKHSLLFN